MTTRQMTGLHPKTKVKQVARAIWTPNGTAKAMPVYAITTTRYIHAWDREHALNLIMETK